ncbi:hypothetical protein [Sporisorium scitamineum]|uniref:Uncharacterized protein n=1 Tax=Sporisorium scitamineum TaxID=49012 RepID=A0A0F7RS53_9BASI|nr:hypothetical protein [Sporisorium scitamineum]
MDANPDFDYEMEPQGAYAAFQSSAEEVMDDLSSEGVPMSDVGVRFETVDKAAIDVDFYDSEPLPKTDAPHVQSEEILDALEASRTAQSHAGQVAQGLDDTVAQEAHEEGNKAGSHVEHSSATPFEATDSAEQLTVQTVESEAYDGKATEHDELHQQEDASALQNSAALANAFPEGDQLRDDGGDSAQPNGQEGESSNGHAYYHSEDEENTTIRVTFHGQDFVMWSAADIPAFLAVAHAIEKTDSSQESEEVVQIEAPVLELAKDILWQPLDSLFAGLRDKKALGDFLDESHELHIAFPDLDLDVAEDNLYCREITLDDLLQLHHGLGLPTSLHALVSECPRFITKYNELAQHVAGILGHQLQHSSDEEEEAANAGHAVTKTGDVVESVYESESWQAPAEAAAAGELGDEHAAVSPNQAAQAATAGGIPEAVSESHPVNPSQSEARAQQLFRSDNTETEAAGDGPDAPQESGQHKPESQEHDGPLVEEDEEEGVDELAGELQGDYEQVEEEGDDEQVEEEGDAAQVTAAVEAGHEAALAEDAEETHQEIDADQTFFTTVNDGSDAEEDELEEPEQGAAQDPALLHPGEDAESTYADEAAEDEQEWQDQGEEQIVEYTEEQGETVLNPGSPSSTVLTSYNIGAQRKRGLDEEDDDEALYEQDDYEAESKRVKVD